MKGVIEAPFASSFTSYEVMIPSKTFIVGEYLALAGGPTVIVNSKPCFHFNWSVLNLSDSSNGRIVDEVKPVIQHRFHPMSPAGRLLESVARDARDARELKDSRSYAVRFHDPFHGTGGFGCSTAEFLGSWLFSQWLKRPRRGERAPEGFDYQGLLRDYKAIIQSGSGADLVSQARGGIAIWDEKSKVMQQTSWPFRDLSFLLLKTGKKIQTHEHLEKFEKSAIKVEALKAVVLEAVDGLKHRDADRFIHSVAQYGSLLENEKLVAHHSQEILKKLRTLPGVRAAKGCGAMGADVIFVLYEKVSQAKNAIIEHQDTFGYKLIGTENEIVDRQTAVEAKEAKNDQKIKKDSCGL